MDYLIAAVGAGVVLLGLWAGLATGPRRRRALKKARALHGKGDWREALAIVARLEEAGRLPEALRPQLQQLAAQYHDAAADAALNEQRYEEAISHRAQAAERRGGVPAEGLERIVPMMLAQ